MCVIPILSSTSEQYERAKQFSLVGCAIYRDRQGQFYAVAETIVQWLRKELTQVYEIAQVPSHWERVDLTAVVN